MQLISVGFLFNAASLKMGQCTTHLPA